MIPMFGILMYRMCQRLVHLVRPRVLKLISLGYAELERELLKPRSVFVITRRNFC